MKPIVCFGEVLWDLLPQGRFLGGAPLNVAYHLAQLGYMPQVVSAVGADGLGDDALAHITNGGLSADWISRHSTLPTGTAAVRLDSAGFASFEIAEPAAWDEISAPASWDLAPAGLVFGSLALRGSANRAVMRMLIRTTPGLRICDLNLRAPYDDLTPLAEFLQKLDLLKLNAEEARRLMPPSLVNAGIPTHAAHLAATYECAAVCITLGEEGALLRCNEKTYRATSPRIRVRDTVGAGDAFTAALLAGMLESGPKPAWSTLLARACALGAFVASCDGAQPHYRAEDVFNIAELRAG